MKFLFIICSFLFTPPAAHWENDFAKATQTATANHKYILLNFSGSDWCGPCIRMHREIFDNETFLSFANDQLILVNADFPRDKKNQLPKSQQKQNDQLADKYNSSGAFPYTVLLTADGKVLKAWDGFPKQGLEAFTNEVKDAIHAGSN